MPCWSDAGILKQAYSFFSHKWSARTLVALLNFLMWFGNTTILLMAGMMGIDPSLYGAAEVDGATSSQIFRRITLPASPPDPDLRYDHIPDRRHADV